MATAKELLMQELKRRQAQEQSDQNAIRGDIQSQRAMAEIDPIYRRNLGPSAQLMDDFYGGNMAKQEASSRPESTEIALRRAFQAQAATPKQNLLGYLQTQMGAENTASNKGVANQMRADKEAQRMREAALKTKEGQNIMQSRKLQEKVGRYQDLVNKHGFQVTGPKRAEIEGAYRELQIAYKNAAELGVIAGPDMMLIEGIAPPSTGFGSIFQSGIKGGKEGVNKALNQLRTSRQQDIDINRDVLNRVFSSPSTQGALEGIYGDRSPQQQAPQQTGYSSDGSLDMKKMTEEELKAIAGGR